MLMVECWKLEVSVTKNGAVWCCTSVRELKSYRVWWRGDSLPTEKLSTKKIRLYSKTLTFFNHSLSHAPILLLRALHAPFNTNFQYKSPTKLIPKTKKCRLNFSGFSSAPPSPAPFFSSFLSLSFQTGTPWQNFLLLFFFFTFLLFFMSFVSISMFLSLRLIVLDDGFALGFPFKIWVVD